jgi:hypothetical protein
LFINNANDAFFVRELGRRVGAQINAIRNELDNLVAMDLVALAPDFDVDAGEPEDVAKPKNRRSAGQRKYYRINTESRLYPEIRALFMKAQIMLEKDFVRKLGSTGHLSYLALTGFFVSEDPSTTDLLVVGKVNRDKLATVIRGFEKQIGREVNYTVLTPQEFRYRRDVTDRFLYSILESKKMVVIDTITEQLRVPA